METLRVHGDILRAHGDRESMYMRVHGDREGTWGHLRYMGRGRVNGEIEGT